MSTLVKNIVSAFHLRSKSGNVLDRLVALNSYRRHLTIDLSNSSELMPTDPNSAVFMEWHNGGGLFHRSACIDPTARIDIGAIVHPYSVLAADVHISSGAQVGPSVSIGQSTKVGYNAVLCNCSVGLSCVIHNGACIGQDGFGFFVDKEGNVLKKPQGSIPSTLHTLVAFSKMGYTCRKFQHCCCNYRVWTGFLTPWAEFLGFKQPGLPRVSTLPTLLNVIRFCISERRTAQMVTALFCTWATQRQQLLKSLQEKGEMQIASCMSGCDWKAEA